jgi:hypothetical protein
MFDSGIPPTGAGSSNPVNPNNSNESPATGPFAKAFPDASPAQLKQITNTFINFSIQQMKQDQQNMLEALKKMQDDQD